MGMSKVPKKRVALWLSVVIVIILLILTILSYLPSSRDNMVRSVALVECRSYYSVKVDGKRLFYFSALTRDTLFERVDTVTVNVSKVNFLPACWVRPSMLWPFCQGRMVVSMSSRGDSLRTFANREGMRLLEREMDRLVETEKSIAHVILELDYYLNVHNVQEEGYNLVSTYVVKACHDRDSVSKVLSLLRGVRHGAKVEVVPVKEFSLLTYDENGKLVRRPCRMLSQSDSSGLMILQTEDGTSPDGICSQSLHRWLPWRCSKGDQVFAVGYGGINTSVFDATKSEASLTSGSIVDDNGRLDMPRLLVPDGSPVFSRNGCFLGLVCDGRVVSADVLSSSLKKGGAR